MRPIDSVKMLFLLAAILVWMVGFRTNNRVLVGIAVGFVFVAFLLRFVKSRPKPPPPDPFRR